MVLVVTDSTWEVMDHWTSMDLIGLLVGQAAK